MKPFPTKNPYLKYVPDSFFLFYQKQTSTQKCPCCLCGLQTIFTDIWTYLIDVQQSTGSPMNDKGSRYIKVSFGSFSWDMWWFPLGQLLSNIFWPCHLFKITDDCFSVPPYWHPVQKDFTDWYKPSDHQPAWEQRNGCIFEKHSHCRFSCCKRPDNGACTSSNTWAGLLTTNWLLNGTLMMCVIKPTSAVCLWKLCLFDVDGTFMRMFGLDFSISHIKTYFRTCEKVWRVWSQAWPIIGHSITNLKLLPLVRVTLWVIKLSVTLSGDFVHCQTSCNGQTCTSG